MGAARPGGGVVEEEPALTLAQGYAVAAALAGRMGSVSGWKGGATSAGAMAFLGVEAPIHGRLFRLFRDGDIAVFPGERPLEVEPEVLLLLGDDLQPVAAHAGAEFNRPSFAAPFAHGTGAIVADNAASCGVLIGPPLPLAALEDPAALAISLSVNGAVACRGSADVVLGNPLRALAALRAALADDPRGLRPGDWIATGAMCRAAVIGRGDRLQLDAGLHGGATLTLG
ncbi:hypothetical protein GCM10007973_20020 [Polymorphobacter multimanifer]|nr:hypothetical protein GCM10007973_20020 [Polymorphobacter multimanifer]